jgi:hypothetical protein
MQKSISFLIIVLVFITVLLPSCFTTVSTFYRSSRSKKTYWAIRRFSDSNCGCTDVFAQGYEKGKLTYEFYYGCTPFFTSEKIIYKYENKKLVSTTKYRLTDSSHFDIAFDSLDLAVIQKIDSFTKRINPRLPEWKLCKKKYTGLLKGE